MAASIAKQTRKKTNKKTKPYTHTPPHIKKLQSPISDPKWQNMANYVEDWAAFRTKTTGPPQYQNAHF